MVLLRAYLCNNTCHPYNQFCDVTQKLLDKSCEIDTKIVIIAPGVYKDMDEYEKQAKDSRGLPLAIAYWRDGDGWKDFLMVTILLLEVKLMHI